LSACRHTVSDCAVEHAQRALDFGGEVDVTRSIDDVDADVAPEAGRRRGGNRDPALLLLLHPVHDRSAFMDFADFVRNSGVKENPLCRRRLAGIDVRHDADVACPFERCLPRHYWFLSPCAWSLVRYQR
jgi:hypothetical protein